MLLMADDLKQHGPNPLVRMPDLCYRHQYDLVRRRLHLEETDPWRAAIIEAQMLLLQAALVHPSVQARSEGNPLNLSIVLAEIGCLACFLPQDYRTAVVLIKDPNVKTGDLIYRRAKDPRWPHA
jgi:hypothetical protein